MDAMPVDFSDELLAWSSQLHTSRKMLSVIEEISGTATGWNRPLEVALMPISNSLNSLLRSSQSYQVINANVFLVVTSFMN